MHSKLVNSYLNKFHFPERFLIVSNKILFKLRSAMSNSGVEL